MKLSLRQQITQFEHLLQDELFPILEEACGAMDDTTRRLVATLEMPLEHQACPGTRIVLRFPLRTD